MPTPAAPALTPDHVSLKRWTDPVAANPATVTALEQATRQPRFICELLAQRGITNVDEARTFLKPALTQLHDPFALKGMDTLVERLLAARSRGDTIGIHGDYDVDGIASTALYTRALRAMGFTVAPFVPHRMIDGYGVSLRALEQFTRDGVRVVLTCDTGFSAVEEVRVGVEQHQLEILITDHHHPPAVLPAAHALVNPQQPGCAYPNKALCGTGVAFKVLQALAQRLGLDERHVLYRYLDLVALGTVCDVVPLTGENRALVKFGVQVAQETQNPGLQAMLRLARVKPEEVSEDTFGWRLGPRLNAAGRVDDAAKGLSLLLTDDPAEAQRLAVVLEDLNTQRRTITQAIEDNAVAQIEQQPLDDVFGIVLAGHAEFPAPDGRPAVPTPWHHGVIGIVASRIVERYGRPTMLLAWDEAAQAWKGSGRAPETGAVHLYDALAVCAPHLTKFGGHRGAAGATLAGTTPAAVAAFREAFNAAIRQQMTPEERIPTLAPDVALRLTDITADAYDLMKRFAPFGQGNEPITMCARDVEIVEVKPMGADGRHLRFTVRQYGVAFTAVGWQLGERLPTLATRPTPFPADICFRFRENTYRGRTELQLELDDIRVAAPVLALEATPQQDRLAATLTAAAPLPAQAVATASVPDAGAPTAAASLPTPARSRSRSR